MEERNFTLSDRNNRFLLVFPFIYIVITIMGKTIELIRSDLSRIYIYDSGTPYLKISQGVPVIIFVVSLFLLAIIMRYIYYEAVVFSIRGTGEFQILHKKVADASYENVLYYLRMFFYVVFVYLFIGALMDKLGVVANNFKLYWPIVIILSLAISILWVRRKAKVINLYTPSLTSDICVAILFIVFCFSSLLVFLPYDTVGDFNVEYTNQYIKISVEANTRFEQIQIKANGSEIGNVKGENEMFFYIRRHGEDNITGIAKKAKGQIFVEEKNDYFYYSKMYDISDYTTEGQNEISVFLEIGGKLYSLVNPLILEDKNYNYMKTSHEVKIN